MRIPDRFVTRFARSPLARGIHGKLKNVPVVGPLFHRGAELLIPRGKRVWVQVQEQTAPRIWLSVDPRFEQHLINGEYEAAGHQLLNDFLRPGECFYDLGAHIGVFSMIAARIVQKQGTVLSFEPDPANAKVLAANAARNGFSCIRVIEAAAWSSNDTLQFVKSNPNSSGMEGHISEKPAQGKAVNIRAVALDDFVSAGDNRPPDFIKMDVEGAESEALKGSVRLLREKRPLILCEVHSAENAHFVESFLQTSGYKFQWLNQASPSYPRQLFASPV